MKVRNTLTVIGLTIANGAWAHPGHGAGDNHYHGEVLLGLGVAALALAWALGRFRHNRDR
ncbi:MAG: hypothetical protein AAGE01_23725 [Pseudomonadota bacterium]